MNKSKPVDRDLKGRYFFRLAKDNSPLPDAGQYMIYEADRRIAKPDFFFKSKNIALFIDGPPHERLSKRTTFKREESLRTEDMGSFQFHIQT